MCGKMHLTEIGITQNLTILGHFTLQPAYKRFHSSETALLKIHNDIVDNMDNGKVTALPLLDLSAAFDTIDITMLCRKYISLTLLINDPV